MDWKRWIFPIVLIFILAFVILPQVQKCFAPPVEEEEIEYPRIIETDLPEEGGVEISLTELVEAIKAGDVISLKVGVGEAQVLATDGRKFTVKLGTLEAGDVIPTLRSLEVTEAELAAVRIEYLPPPTNWLGTIRSFAPLIFIGVIFFWFIRRSAGAESGIGSGLAFGKSRARRLSPAQPTVTFGDIGGCQEAIEEMRVVVDFLRKPEKFTALGARLPKGIILVGPPGCGKTLMARAVAGEAKAPFFIIAGSEFVEMFVGVGASRVRDLFDQAKKNAPSIVFVDEVDAVGRMRGGLSAGGGREYEQTIAQVLYEMDGFDANTNVIVLAATNRPDILDPALTRKGRFDRTVVISRPDLNGREKIFEIHTSGKPLANDVNLRNLARMTSGFSGADIEAMVNEAAILAARQDKRQIEMADLHEALEIVMAGPERKSKLVSGEEKEIIAHHEAGHALVMTSLEHCDPVRKVSTIARGMMLGYTFGTPEEDRWLIPKAKLLDDIAGLLGGRAAEELLFKGDANKVTTGAASDLERATEIARNMVIRFGMSDLGLQTFTRSRQDYLRELFGEVGMSPKMAERVDDEVGKIITQCYKRAEEVLTERWDILMRVVAELREKETLTEEEFNALVS